MDAKDGTMEFLVVDESDPILATYQQIFPTLFKGKETISRRSESSFPLSSGLV